MTGEDGKRGKGEKSYLSGSGPIVYGRERYHGILSGLDYVKLVTKKKGREIAKGLEKILAVKAPKKENSRVYEEDQRTVVFSPDKNKPYTAQNNYEFIETHSR